MPKKLIPGNPSVSFSKSGRSVTVRDSAGNQVRRMLSTIAGYASKIHQRSVKTSEKFMSTPKFPDELGLDGQYTIIIREEALDVSDILRGEVGDVPADKLYADIKKLENIAKSPAAFEDAYYGYIGEYYTGRDVLTTEQVKGGLSSGAFKVPAADVLKAQSGNTVAEQDYAALKAWIKDHNPRVKVRAINALHSQAELLSIVQDIENNIEIDPSLLNKSARRGKYVTGSYYTNKLKPEQRKR